jgi:glyoxylase-like metal-dependent hydrolase (beta-lactamase superfamily II)
MEIRSFQVTPFIVNCFVVKDGDEAIVIDPGEVTPALLRCVQQCKVRLIVNTHCHCDHCGGNAELKARTGADLAIHKEELPLLRSMAIQAQMFGVSVTPSPDPDRFLREGDTVEVGSVSLKVLDAPGHSPGHIMLAGDGFVFAGDVLFAGSIGRTDLPGGDYHTLMESIRTKLLPFPDDTVVYTGHGPATTIGAERNMNPFLVDL